VLADIAAAADLACSYEARDCLRQLSGNDSALGTVLGWDLDWSNGMSMYSDLAADEGCTAATGHGSYAARVYELRQQQLDDAADPHDVGLRVNGGAHCGDPACETCHPITDNIIRTAFTPEEQQAIV